MEKKKILFGLVLISIIIVMGCCSLVIGNKIYKPRDGRALNDSLVIVYSANYNIKIFGLERLHPFDMCKYDRIYKQLVKDALLKPDDVYVPAPITEKEILRVHSQEFLDSLKDSRTVATYLEAPAVGILPALMVDEGVNRPFRHSSGGTLLAARLALQHGIGINIGGGFHHAKPDYGEGFCVYADIPIAIRTLQAENKIDRTLIIDLDVHQGNGTAVCLADDSNSFTFSMHQDDIYPIPKERSDLDIELKAGTNDAIFLNILSRQLPRLFKQAKPDIVFLVAGCDTLADDPLASLEMTEQGIVKRDAMVIDACVQNNVPVIMTLGGGYSPNAWHAQYASIRNVIRTYGINPPNQ
ncbi:histone deacetylase [Planctomycetota bacterium]